MKFPADGRQVVQLRNPLHRGGRGTGAVLMLGDGPQPVPSRQLVQRGQDRLLAGIAGAAGHLPVNPHGALLRVQAPIFQGLDRGGTGIEELLRQGDGALRRDGLGLHFLRGRVAPVLLRLADRVAVGIVRGRGIQAKQRLLRLEIVPRSLRHPAPSTRQRSATNQRLRPRPRLEADFAGGVNGHCSSPTLNTLQAMLPKTLTATG